MRSFFTITTIFAGVLATGPQLNFTSLAKCNGLLTQLHQLKVFDELQKADEAGNNQIMPVLKDKLDKCMLLRGLDINEHFPTQHPFNPNRDNENTAMADMLEDDICDVYFSMYTIQADYQRSLGTAINDGVLLLSGKADMLCQVCDCDTNERKELVAALNKVRDELKADIKAAHDHVKESFPEYKPNEWSWSDGAHSEL